MSTEIVSHPDAATPGWGEQWPPDAPEDALVVVLAELEPCLNCGKIHPYVTTGCQPVLWAGRFRNFALPGEWFSKNMAGKRRYMVPPCGLVGAVISENNPAIMVVRSTSWREESRDPEKSVEPYSWAASWSEQ